MEIAYAYTSLTAVEDVAFFAFVLDDVAVGTVVIVVVVEEEEETIVLSSSFVFEWEACKTFLR